MESGHLFLRREAGAKPGTAHLAYPGFQHLSQQQPGDFHYDIPLKNGIYELRLHFAETFYGPEEIGGGGEGSRIMAVNANGKPLLNDFDVALDAGASRTADVKVFTGISPAPDGKLHLDFSSVRGGSAMLSAIEILPGLPERQRPVRMVARDLPYYSDDSRWWGPDNYFKGGQITASDQPVTDEDDPELFETERWGHFSYAIPVAPGRYLAVTFQQVVHSMKTGEADCVEAIQHFGDIEWTFTRMPDSLPFCERSWLTKFFSVDWL